MRIPTEEPEDEGGIINLTPLIDIVFLLLIFFMVTAKFQEDERDLQVTLPDAENATQTEKLPKTIYVGVRKDGTFTVSSKRVDKDELKRLLVRAKRENPKQKVVIRSDQDAATRYPVTVMDICAGLDIDISLGVTEPKGD